MKSQKGKAQRNLISKIHVPILIYSKHNQKLLKLIKILHFLKYTVLFKLRNNYHLKLIIQNHQYLKNYNLGNQVNLLFYIFDCI